MGPVIGTSRFARNNWRCRQHITKTAGAGSTILPTSRNRNTHMATMAIVNGDRGRLAVDACRHARVSVGCRFDSCRGLCCTSATAVSQACGIFPTAVAFLRCKVGSLLRMFLGLTR